MIHNKKILGVIGGLGPAATTQFMNLIIDMTDAASDQEHMDMIVFNAPSIPDRTGYILDNSQPCPMDCSPQGTSVYGDSPEGILEWVVMPSSRGSSQPRD